MLISLLMIATVSYRDVRPIFEKRCAQCHDAKWPAKNWMEYDVAYANRLVIKRRVWDNLSMPPSSMPFDERRVIKKWVDQGAKR